MLNAILNGKKYGTGLEGIQISEEFVGAEDTLTSTVFERLLYLPDESIITILFSPNVWVNPLDKVPQEINDHEFWPWWKPTTIIATDGLDTAEDGACGSGVTIQDQKFIQPDLVIKFDDRVLIIETK